MKNTLHAGFTLVELVIALALMVIVVSFSAMFIAVPIQGYEDQTRRGRLVASADSALHRLSRDIRRALPNSVRVVAVGTGFAAEMLNTVDGARYRSGPPPADDTKALEFDAPDDEFNTLGGFARIAKPFTSTNHYLSVYNVGVAGANAWEQANVITPAGTQIDVIVDSIAGEDHVTLTPAFKFAFESPTQRVYLIDTPVTWLCDPAAGTLSRYSGYTIATDQTTRDAAAELIAAGATETLVASDVAGCDLTYAPGTAWRAGLVSARLEVARAGERIALQHQVHVENAP